MPTIPNHHLLLSTFGNNFQNYTLYYLSSVTYRTLYINIFFLKKKKKTIFEILQIPYEKSQYLYCTQTKFCVEHKSFQGKNLNNTWIN